MSFPSKDTICGKIQYNGKEYDILDRPLSNIIKNRIERFKLRNNCGLSSASWSFDKYKWQINFTLEV